MPEDIIIYDAEYLTEQSKILDEATALVSEAVRDLKKASLHEGWTCQECDKINEKLNEVTRKLNQLNDGMSETSAALSSELENFDELETEAENQANNLSEDLRDNYGFEASAVNSDTGAIETIKAPVTQVPASEGVSANFIEPLGGSADDAASSSSSTSTSSTSTSTSTKETRIQVKDILQSLGSGSSDSSSALSSLSSSSSSSSGDGNGTNWLQVILSLIFNKKIEDLNVDKA